MLNNEYKQLSTSIMEIVGTLSVNMMNTKEDKNNDQLRAIVMLCGESFKKYMREILIKIYSVGRSLWISKRLANECISSIFIKEKLDRSSANIGSVSISILNRISKEINEDELLYFDLPRLIELLSFLGYNASKYDKELFSDLKEFCNTSRIINSESKEELNYEKEISTINNLLFRIWKFNVKISKYIS